MKENYTRRDLLAKDRTYLANERTFLAYIRTSLAFLALGIFLIKFLSSRFSVIIAIIFLALGVCLFIFGLINFFQYKKIINKK